MSRVQFALPDNSFNENRYNDSSNLNDTSPPSSPNNKSKDNSHRSSVVDEVMSIPQGFFNKVGKQMLKNVWYFTKSVFIFTMFCLRFVQFKLLFRDVFEKRTYALSSIF